jgi:hypothetical protein
VTKVVADKKRARMNDKNRLACIEALREQGRQGEADSLARTHKEQQRIRADYESS